MSVPKASKGMRSAPVPVWPETARFPSENGGVLGQIGLEEGPAFSHVGEIDPGPGLSFKAVSCRSQTVCISPPPPV